MEKVIVIVGPTGVGKTKLSIELAKKFNGEIINADSMQIYKHLNIGTAKVTDEEKENIVHHLLDIKELDEDYTVYNYQKDARNKITEITNKNKLPIIVGGTGLYIKACLYNYEFKEESSIKNNYKDIDNETLYNMLLEINKETNIHPNNRQRIIRALNYYNENKTNIDKKDSSDTLLYDATIIGLTTDRNSLYERINKRVDIMFEQGLLEEVKDLYNKKIYTKPVITGIGYKELYSYFNKEKDIEEVKELIKKNSRHYAKRQYTFFNNQFKVNWFNIDNNFNNTVEEIIQFIRK